MILENYWFTGLLKQAIPICPSLDKDISADCLVIGGGFAGLHAALKLIDSGKKVFLIEKSICGGGASGKSAGFITADSEMDLAQIADNHGIEESKKVASIPHKGVSLIKNNIKKFNLACDYREQDSLYLSIKKSHDSNIDEEAEIRKEANLPFKVYSKNEIKSIHPSDAYTKAILAPGTFGINPLAYCQSLKSVLIKKGVKIYEGTEVHSLSGNTALCHRGKVSAKNIIVCIDKMKTEFHEEISKKYYHVQSFVTISEPLTDKEMKCLFPKKEMMCWDTKMVYLHYRPIAGNRILLGGNTVFKTYTDKLHHHSNVIESVIAEFKSRFPKLNDVDFINYWPGLIDITKDLTPIADYDPKNKSIQYALGCAGLPWAAFCGDYLASRIVDKKTPDFSKYLGMNRKFIISDTMQKFFGKYLSFSLSNYISLYGLNPFSH